MRARSISRPTRVGIFTPYDGSAASRLAVQVAELLALAGVGVVLVARGRVGRVHPLWDRRVRSGRTLTFGDLPATGCTHVVWTSPANVAQLYLTAAVGLRPVLAAGWSVLEGANAEALAACAAVVCHSAHAAQLLRDRWQLPNVAHVPWAPSVAPVVRHTLVTPDRVRVLVPVGRGTLRQLPAGWLRRVAGGLIARFDNVDVTVAGPASAARSLGRQLRGLDRRRLRLAVAAPDDPAVYLRHDLTLSPERRGGGLEAVATSLACGAPVVAYAVPPANEYVADDGDGVLVPAPPGTTPGGRVVALDDGPTAYLEAACRLLAQRNALRKLRAGTADRAEARLACFAAGWGAVLGLARAAGR